MLFGLHYVAARLVVEEIPPRTWSLMRAGASGIILLAFTLLGRMELPRGREVLLRLAGLSLLGVAINQYLFVEGIHRTTPAHSALICTSIPVVVLSIAVMLGRERATLARVCGILLTLAGVLALIGPERLDWGSRSFQGDLLTLCNAISYSLFLVLGKPVFEKERTLPATALLLVFGTMWLVPVGAVGVGGLLSSGASGVSPSTWWLAAFIVIGPTIGAYVMNTYALRRVDSSIVALFIYLQPLVGAGLSIATGVEEPTPRLLLASIAVFAGIFITLHGSGTGTAR